MGVRAVATITASGMCLLLGSAPGEKVLHALGKLRAGGLRLLQVRLELHRLLVGRRERVKHTPLRARHRLAWLRCELVGQVARLFLQSLRRDGPADNAEPEGIDRLQRL